MVKKRWREICTSSKFADRAEWGGGRWEGLGLAYANENADIRRAGAGKDGCGEGIFAVGIMYSINLTTIAKIVTARKNEIY